MLLLVAEDHPSLARSLVKGLREEGFAVDLASTGPDALHCATTAPYDCVVLDMMLPGMDGWAVLRALRRRGRDNPVLCLTARDGIDDRVRGLDLGADDYLTKPFAWDELVSRVRALIRRRHAKPAPIVSIADLRIDTASKAVTRGGRRVRLSAREYALLEYLAMRLGEVVSRSDIWAHLYDQNDETGSNVVDVYIGYLRNKLDRGSGPRLIHTRRGLGYVLAIEPP